MIMTIICLLHVKIINVGKEEIPFPRARFTRSLYLSAFCGARASIRRTHCSQLTSNIFLIQESLIGDLLSMDIGGPPAPAAPASNLDLLAGGLDVLVLYHFSLFFQSVHKLFINYVVWFYFGFFVKMFLFYCFI